MIILCSRRLAMRLVHLFDFCSVFVAADLIMLISVLSSLSSSLSLSSSGDQKFVATRYVWSVLILLFLTPGCHVSVISVPVHLQVLFEDSQFDGRDSLFFSNSQQSSLAFEGCFFPQCLQIGASLYFLRSSSLFFFFSSSVCLVGLVGLLLSYGVEEKRSWDAYWYAPRVSFDWAGGVLRVSYLSRGRNIWQLFGEAHVPSTTRILPSHVPWHINVALGNNRQP